MERHLVHQTSDLAWAPNCDGNGNWEENMMGRVESGFRRAVLLDRGACDLGEAIR